MLKKCFLITQFGNSHEWTQEYIDGVQHLAKDGWSWKIFTPNKLESKGNVEIIPMDTEQFNSLVEEKLGVRPNFYITKIGVPSVHVTDFYIFSGIIFEDYIKDVDYWGITNMDVVYGRLSKFLPDEDLSKYEVWSDDINTINGVFCLWKNTEKVNNLFRKVPNWERVISQPACRACIEGDSNSHNLYGSDEIIMTELMRALGHSGEVAFGYPPYYAFHSHDRLEQHVPEVRLEVTPDSALWELFRDTLGPDWVHGKSCIGKEIMYFHFSRTKKWPL